MPPWIDEPRRLTQTPLRLHAPVGRWQKRPRIISGAAILSQTKLVLLRAGSRGSLFALFLSALWFPLPMLSATRRSSARLCVGTLPLLFSASRFTWSCARRRRPARLAKCRRGRCPLSLWAPHMPALFGRVRCAAGRLLRTWAGQAALRSSFLFARRLRCLGSRQGCAGLPGRRWSRLQSPPTRPAMFFSRRSMLDAWRSAAAGNPDGVPVIQAAPGLPGRLPFSVGVPPAAGLCAAPGMAVAPG